MRKRRVLVSAAVAAFALASLIPLVRWDDAEAQTLPDITLSSTYAWDTAPGAAAYNVEVLNSVNAQVNPPGIIQVTQTSIGVDQFLFVGGTIAAPGTYKFRVQSVGPGGSPVSAWIQTNANFTGLGPPTNPRFE